MTGRAKAVIGFVMGDDKVLATGPIERTKAAERVTAVAEEANAEATERKAAAEASDQIRSVERMRADAEKKERRRKEQIARETRREQDQIEAEALVEKAAVETAAQEAERVIDATDATANAEAGGELFVAEAEEIAAEESRAEAEALERVQRGSGTDRMS